MRFILSLARRAIKRASVAHGNSLDRPRARPALLALTVIDPEMFLKLAVAIFGIAIIGEGCSAPADRLSEDTRREFGDALDLRAPELPGPRRRPDSGMKKDLVGVDISQTGDGSLVDQEVSNPSAGIACQGVEMIGAEAPIERLRS